MGAGSQRPPASSPNNTLPGGYGQSNPGNGVARQPEPLILHNQVPPYNGPLVDGASAYPARGTRPRSTAVPYAQGDSRFASIITVLILLATLLLLGFSIYLAAELNYIHIPGLSSSNATPTTRLTRYPYPT